MTSAAKNAARAADSIKLIVATKTQPAELLAELYQQGLRMFGENYVSEAIEKIPQLPEDIDWHFIGPIQSNKTRLIAEHFDWVQTVDREKIARRLSAQRPQHLPPLKCLIQINISDDPQKSGTTTKEDTLKLADIIASLPNLTLKGLMTIPKAAQNEEALASDFAKMQCLSTSLMEKYPEASELSMGMSGDYELAIEHGATFVRVGTAIVGPRKDK